MILKGNIRAGGQELARHLMNTAQELDPEATKQPATIGNEAVELAEVRGFAASDLKGAFREVEAIATGTRCTKPLYSLSINPGQPMSRDQYAQAIETIEAKLGLQDQARAVVFHKKHGREHCHVVWSRIDTETMTTRHNGYDRQKLREVARELVRAFGHDMPKHLGADRGVDRHKAKFNAKALTEQGQEARSGLSPAERKATITEAYRAADGLSGFRHALAEKGFVIAKGDRAAFVVVDRGGETHSLNRQIEGAKAKEIEAKLGLKQARDMPSVQAAKEQQAAQNRQQAQGAAQEPAKGVDRAKAAAEAMKALRDAQAAELTLLKTAHRDALHSIREREAEKLDYADQAIKAAYRPDWVKLYRDQKAEIAGIQDSIASPARRLKALLQGRAGDAFDFENRSTLAGAFRFLVKGEVDLTKLEKRHIQERRDLGDLQKAARTAEMREIKAEAKQERGQVQEDHKASLTTLSRSHHDERSDAERMLDLARGGDDGTGLSSGASSSRPSARRSFLSHLTEHTGADAIREANREVEEEQQRDRERGDDAGRGMAP